MSVQSALLFIQRVTEDEPVREAVAGLGQDPELLDLVAIGRRLGLEFSVEDLREAFARDWAMRRAHFSGIVEE
jgi:predicted ribosomally synthesized peptide with nif11-like leader